MLQSVAAGALFGVGMGMVVYLLAGAALSLLLSRWLAEKPASVREAFLTQHSSVEDVAAKWAIPLACGALGAIAAIS